MAVAGGLVGDVRQFGCAVAAFVLLTYATALAQWPQWGGPHRDFTIETEGLANVWPDDGPTVLWSRDLGEGYSSIIVDGALLYTMYRVDEDEFTIALDAETGRTVWEHGNPSPFTEAMTEFGPGPHSTPLVSQEHLFTIGTNAVMHCFDKKHGKVLWKRNLITDLGGRVFHYGYACSPIAYKNTVIVPVGRSRSSLRTDSHHHDSAHAPATEHSTAQSLVAFDQTTGDIVWRSQNHEIDYSSPILIQFDGQSQLVLLLNRGIMAVCPDTGRLLWHHAIPSHHGGNFTTPLWLGDGLLFCSSSHTHSRMIRLSRQNGKTIPKELWHSRKMGVSHGSIVRSGDLVLGSSGRGQGPALLAALDIHTGERAWVQRGFDTATLVRAGGKMILLTEDGRLVLATVTPAGVRILSQRRLTESVSWTTPTLVGTTLFVRDRKHIMALDLG